MSVRKFYGFYLECPFKDNIGFEELLNHSNSVCEALILRLKNPDLILVNIYRPPNASCEDFNEVLNEVRK